ncbi:hypothetical protein KIW84_061876 [Lathyrus oleraceus]|uniref:Reverse transcriptase zinc-binding domain-containing protein n=1 Tax=Pisum sativum TaxID=3888 RepID=A0A9D5A4S6_PEA|nr:hypothetical protein KIW84_061876 [Pisum sativum]
MHDVSWNTYTLPKDHEGLGLRDLATMNNACILKLSWKLINEFEDIWCKVLRGIYKDVHLSQNPTKKSSGYGLWRAINKFIPYLLKHGKWSIDDGISDDAWEDNWIEVGTCISNHVQSILDSLRGANVCDLVTGRGDLNWKILQQWLPQAHDWKIIWRLKVPEVIKTFVWLLKHDRLLTNQSKSQRGLGVAACKLYGHAIETTLHVFRECPCALEVWVNKVPTEMQHEFFNLELKD